MNHPRAGEGPRHVLSQAYQAKLGAQRMMSNELYLTLMYRPNFSRVSRALQSTQRSRATLTDAQADALRVMEERSALVGRVKIGPSPAHGACANSHLRREALLSDHTVNRCATQSGHADDRRHAREAGPGVDVDGVSRFARLSHGDCPLDRDVHTLVRDIGAERAGFRLFSRVHTRHEEARSCHESRAGVHAVIAISTPRFTRRGIAAAPLQHSD